MKSAIVKLFVSFTVSDIDLNFSADLVLDSVHWDIDPEKFSVQT